MSVLYQRVVGKGQREFPSSLEATSTSSDDDKDESDDNDKSDKRDQGERVMIRVFMMVWRRIKGIVQMILKEYWNEG